MWSTPTWLTKVASRTPKALKACQGDGMLACHAIQSYCYTFQSQQWRLGRRPTPNKLPRKHPLVMEKAIDVPCDVRCGCARVRFMASRDICASSVVKTRCAAPLGAPDDLKCLVCIHARRWQARLPRPETHQYLADSGWTGLLAWAASLPRTFGSPFRTWRPLLRAFRYL